MADRTVDERTNHRDSSPDIKDLSEERDESQIINSVRFSVVNSSQSR